MAGDGAHDDGRQGRESGARILLVISASPDPDLVSRIAEDRFPRKDYLELAKATNGQILFRSVVSQHPISRIVARLLGVPAAQAALAFMRRREFDVVFTDAENIGLWLALLFKVFRVRRRHVMIGHLPSTSWKQLFFRYLKVHSHIDSIICHSSLQRRLLIGQQGVPAERVVLLPYAVDERFWRPAAAAPAGPICSAGLEFRDYRTLIAAVRDLPLDVVIAAASHWSKRDNEANQIALPPNVQVTALNYEDLRRLYAQSRFVVVPLKEVDFQAGITTILEAMAMGKAIVVTQTRGQRDVVRGETGLPLPVVGRPPSGFPDFENECGASADQTGLYVPPGDSGLLRQAIEQLMAHPDQAMELGARGRRLIECLMTLDQYVARIAALLRAGDHIVTR